MEPIKFSDIKEKIQAALEKKLKQSIIPNEDGFTLIEGFMSWNLQPEISNKVVIGGPNVPVVGVLGNTSGRIYTFALKAILPDIKV